MFSAPALFPYLCRPGIEWTRLFLQLAALSGVSRFLGFACTYLAQFEMVIKIHFLSSLI
jgi:hypothetical protein